MLSAVIIDDDRASHLIIKTLLNREFPMIKVAGEAFYALKGLSLIKNLQPDIVFLDYEMPSGSGVEMLEFISFFSDAKVIFSSGYPEIRKTVVDAGAISNGDNTDWVLDPCTSYDFEFWGNEGCPGCSTIQTLTSDGCNGTFTC